MPIDKVCRVPKKTQRVLLVSFIFKHFSKTVQRLLLASFFSESNTSQRTQRVLLASFIFKQISCRGYTLFLYHQISPHYRLSLQG